MDSNAQVDVLLRLRGEMERELDVLRTTLAAKTRTLQHLNETIDLVRGWAPLEATPTVARSAYNDDSIRDGLVDFFSTHEGAHRIADICKFLETGGVCPVYSDAVRGKVTKIIKTMPEFESVGWGAGMRYRLKMAVAVGADLGTQ